MGWFDGEIGQTRVVWHGGAMPDFGAYMAFLPEQHKALVLLFNACHWWFNPVWVEFGMGAAGLLAGEEFRPTPFFSVIPWILRGQLLIPAFQIADVAATLGLLRRWRRDPSRRADGVRKWKKHVLLPLIPSLLLALNLRSVLGRRRDYLRLFMPDYAVISLVCGTFALAWSFVRTGILLQALRRSPAPHPTAGRRIPPQVERIHPRGWTGDALP
jgi:hypothetical protein